MARPCPVEIPTPEKFSTPNLTPTPESTPKSVIGSPKSDTSTSNSGTSSSKSFRTPLSPKFAEKESEAEPRTPVKQIRKFKRPAVAPSVIRPSPWTPGFRNARKCAVHGYFSQSAPAGQRRLPRTCPCDF